MRQARTGSPSSSTVQAPHTPCSQPTWVPVRSRSSRRKSASEVRGSTRPLVRAAVHATGGPCASSCRSRHRAERGGERRARRAPRPRAAGTSAVAWMSASGDERRRRRARRLARAARASARGPRSAASAAPARTGVPPDAEEGQPRVRHRAAAPSPPEQGDRAHQREVAVTARDLREAPARVRRRQREARLGEQLVVGERRRRAARRKRSPRGDHALAAPARARPPRRRGRAAARAARTPDRRGRCCPTTVPRFRIAAWPTRRSASASSGSARGRPALERALARTSAPIAKHAVRLAQRRRARRARLMSTSTPGRASRRFSIGTRLWPPARILASSPCCASSVDRLVERSRAATYSNGAGFMAAPAARGRCAGRRLASAISAEDAPSGPSGVARDPHAERAPARPRPRWRWRRAARSRRPRRCP